MTTPYLIPGMQPVVRAERCSLCGSEQGLLAGKVAFWDLQNSDLVQCHQCRHIQLDPKLTEDATKKGCFAYYKRESHLIPEREQRRNRLRNFRRGVLFGLSMKDHQNEIRDVLEFGPGDGFFLQGLKFVFPNVNVTVLDIVEDVLKFCENTHGYNTLLGSPDSEDLHSPRQFDLVIARDVIEHVNDIPAMFTNLKTLLRPRGFFHFLTPNGYEDVWGHAMLWLEKKETSQLLINHVNYFEGTSLEAYLAKQGFEPVSYYTYKFKHFFRGKGREKSLRWSQAAVPIHAQEFIERPQQALQVTASPKASIREWYITPRFPWLTYLVCAYHHLDVFRLNPERNKGHEIFGLFRKT